jgi:Mrp family chromosome partitioning ATPase
MPVTSPSKQGMVSALAATASNIAITEKSMPAVTTTTMQTMATTTMPVVPTAAVEQAPRTQVWVATHKVPDDPDERLILLRAPDSERAASFRVMRHRLQEHGDPRIIAVTSAREREGKTTCAVNLSLALGECGRARVLLIEANLRTPSLAPLFGFMPPECFSAQLTRHKETPEDAWSVVEVYSPSLHVLAVKPEMEARPLLDGPALRIAIDMLAHAGYDYIVIDTPPVLGAADVNLVEDSVDGVLFVAQARTTPARTLRQAVEQLSPGKLIGVTLLDA